MLNAIKVAEWFIAHNNAVMKYNSADEISNLKIQKLLYYAQGCSLTSLGKMLFPEDIIAWKHGPVVRQVYEKYQRYGRSGIKETPLYPSIDLETEKLLINTYNTFARYSAWELSDRTHMEDPWRLTPALKTIATTLIKNYFTVHYNKVNAVTELTDNIDLLWECSEYKEDWDGEGGFPFGTDFIIEVIDLVSTLKPQPDVGATGRGSIDLEYGSVNSGEKYMDIEIYEAKRKVHLFIKDKTDEITEMDIGMEDVNGYVQQF